MRLKTNTEVKTEYYDSVAEFVRVSETRPTTEPFNEKCNGVEDRLFSRRGSEDFTGTASWEQAQHLLSHGYLEGAKKIINGNGGVKFKGNGTRSRQEIAMVGTMPHVPNAIIGLPKAMIRRVKIVRPQKAISLFYDCSAGSATTADTLSAGGQNIYALTKYLESTGYRVQLYACVFCTDPELDERKASACIKVKDYKQAVNPLLISYPITHPSFFRRHIFHWVETCPFTAHKGFVWSMGRGTKYSYNDTPNGMQDYLRKNGIIGKDDHYLDCEEVSRCTTMEQLLNLIA